MSGIQNIAEGKVMKTEILKGSWVALVTPFKENLEIDFAAVEKLVKMHLDAGTDGILICGTTGEAVTLSFAEKAELMKQVRHLTAGKVPLMFGSGANDTQVAVELTGKAQELGADAVLVVTPYYNKPPQSGLIEHFRKVAAATALPVVLYNVPGRTGCNMLPETVLKLSEVANIVGVKEASGILDQTMEIVRRAPAGFALFSGEDALNLPIMCCGGVGAISVTANVAPKLMKQFCDAALAGNLVLARELHYKLLDLHRNLFCETNPLPTKAALKHKGLCDDQVRLPLTRPTARAYEIISKTLLDLE